MVVATTPTSPAAVNTSAMPRPERRARRLRSRARTSRNYGPDLALGRSTLQRVKIKEVMAALRANGWVEVRTRGSHRQFHHPMKPGTVTVAGKPSVDLPPGTPNSVLKQAGLKK